MVTISKNIYIALKTGFFGGFRGDFGGFREGGGAKKEKVACFFGNIAQILAKKLYYPTNGKCRAGRFFLIKSGVLPLFREALLPIFNP